MLWSSFTALVFAIAAASTAADERHDHGPWNNPLWGPKAASKPNILFIFTDDQDLQLGSLNYLPAVTNRIQKHGFTFENHYATVALCCPSRVSLLRGQHAHNTNITMVAAPGGGYDKFRLSGEDQDYLPHWLRKAGYRAEYIGKLMNQYGTYNWWHGPQGWDHFDGLLDPYTYMYNTPIFSANGERPLYYNGTHQTDVLRAKASDRLQKLLADETQPWYLQVAVVAPHQQFNSTGRWPPVPATRHMALYPGLQAPRTPNFNPAVQKKPSWLGTLPLMNASQIAFSDATYRGRAQSLAGIDELIDDLLNQLDAAGKLEETVIIFSTDHGYHVGQHRVPAGKTLPYQEDTHIPFMIKGPNIRPGSTLTPSNHVDIAPTLLTLVGLPKSEWPPFLDGRDMSVEWSKQMNHGHWDARHQPANAEVMHIEYWGPAVIEGALSVPPAQLLKHSYKTIRIIGSDYGYLYSHWCTNETELYDSKTDPYELNPLARENNISLFNRLNALLLVTKTCYQDSCRAPWKTIHPDGAVSTLAEALNSKYDALYATFPQVSFGSCLEFQQIANEQPYFPTFDPNDPKSFARNYRNSTALLGTSEYPGVNTGVIGVPEVGHFGAAYLGVDATLASARELTNAELGSVPNVRRGSIPNYGIMPAYGEEVGGQ